MQHGVIVFVLRAPEVLHAQTLGGNMLSRDTHPQDLAFRVDATDVVLPYLKGSPRGVPPS